MQVSWDGQLLRDTDPPVDQQLKQLWNTNRHWTGDLDKQIHQELVAVCFHEAPFTPKRTNVILLFQITYKPAHFCSNRWRIAQRGLPIEGAQSIETTWCLELHAPRMGVHDPCKPTPSRPPCSVHTQRPAAVSANKCARPALETHTHLLRAAAGAAQSAWR